MKILVIQQKRIGDVLTSSILLEGLKKRFPGAVLHYLVYPHTRQVLENNPHIDKILLYPPEINNSPGSFLKFTRKIQAENYHVILDAYSKIGTAFMCGLSGAKTISYRKWYTSFFYDHTFNYKTGTAGKAGFAVENRIQLLEALDTSFPAEIKPRIFLQDEEVLAAKTVLANAGLEQGRPLFMVSALGSSAKKTYPLPYLAQLLNKICEKSSCSFLFNYEPQQEAEARELYNLCKPATQKNIYLEVYGKDLRSFMALTSLCDALIGNEGGAVNMAKALDVPTFSIFSPGVRKEVWGIYEDDFHHVSVHIQDYLATSKKSIFRRNRKKNDLYLLFTPDLFSEKLSRFTENIIASKRNRDSQQPPLHAYG